MKQQSHSEKKWVNEPSSLLSREENDLVYSLLGRKCNVSFTFFFLIHNYIHLSHKKFALV